MNMRIPHDVEAVVTFLPTEHGGRRGHVWSDYRQQFYYAGQDWDAPHVYPDVESVQPGDTVRAFIGFLSPYEHFGKISVGMPFLIREGQKIVGYGSVRKIIELEESAARARARNA